MMLIDALLKDRPDAMVDSVIIGLHWTAVSISRDGKRYCGLSSTVSAPHEHGSGFDVPQAGNLTKLSAIELAGFCKKDHPTLASVGTAALNALLQDQSMAFEDINAEEIIATHGTGKKVAIIGHFPFTDRVRQIASELFVLENRPQAGDLLASMAPEIIPQANVIAITGMTFVNKTLEALLQLRHPEATVIVLGASTPLHPMLFDYGIDYLCGARTIDIDAVLKTVSEGAVYRQIAKAGLRLVTASKGNNP